MEKPPFDAFQEALDRTLSRRAALGRLAGGAVAATLVIGGRGEARAASPLATPLDDQLAWVLAALNSGARSLTAADVTAHLAPELLTAVPAEQVVPILQQVAAELGPVTLDGATRPPTVTQVNALITSGNGVPLVVPIAIEAARPHRITGFTFAPVPPPPGVRLAPIVDAAGKPCGRRDGLVDVDGRRFYLTCVGSGSPTVVLESGVNDPAAPWFAIERALAKTTRVCSYDRANTSGGASDSAPTPRTASDIVADLHALLTAAAETGPYVLVGHSFGGPVGRLYASTYPDEVAGLVLIDSPHEEQHARLKAVLSPEHWAVYQQMYIAIEGIDLDATFAQMRDARAAAPLRPMPLVVMTAGRAADPALLPPDWPVEKEQQLWHELRDDLATLVPNARHVVAEQSGHYIHQSQPDLVADAIRQVVEAVRDPDSWATPTAGATLAAGG